MSTAVTCDLNAASLGGAVSREMLPKMRLAKSYFKTDLSEL